MSAREIVLKPISSKKVAKNIDTVLLKTKKKEETLKKAKTKMIKEGFVLK